MLWVSVYPGPELRTAETPKAFSANYVRLKDLRFRVSIIYYLSNNLRDLKDNLWDSVRDYLDRLKVTYSAANPNSP